jgi:hypothetical protein
MWKKNYWIAKKSQIVRNVLRNSIPVIKTEYMYSNYVKQGGLYQIVNVTVPGVEVLSPGQGKCM